jgi:hypothetical protein
MGDAMSIKKRGLSPRFMEDLKEGGVLHPLLRRVRWDATLDLEIRENYLNVYYRGGSLVKVAPVLRGAGKYTLTFNTNYLSKAKSASADLKESTVASATDTKKWIEYIPVLKDTMDLWFGAHPKDERALQQMVVWENNDSSWANSTDYFIVDIEYDSRKGNADQGGRFDLVALRWESDATSRKLRGKKRPKLVVIEMKAGDGALKGKAGLQDHISVLLEFAASKPRKAMFVREMLGVFAQKRELNLIRGLSRNKNVVAQENVDTNIGFMLLLAGHDPASKKLSRELRTLQTELPIMFSTANFMGFGLYNENMHTLLEFRDRFSTQI